MPQLVIFSDFGEVLGTDGSISSDQVQGAIEQLGREGIPLIFASTRTAAEMVTMQRRLGLHAPFIAERGSAVYVPKGYFPFGFQSDRSTATHWIIELGTPHRALKKFLSEVSPFPDLAIRGFGDMGIDAVATLTGLPAQAAAREMVREYGEILVLEGPPASIERFGALARSSGLALVPAGNFHLLHGDADPGLAVLVLSALFVRRHGRIVSAALGQVNADLPMLAAVNLPVLLGGRLLLKDPFQVPEKHLPFHAKSWAQGVKHILQKAAQAD